MIAGGDKARADGIGLSLRGVRAYPDMIETEDVVVGDASAGVARL
jgi:hypothetical protein